MSGISSDAVRRQLERLLASRVFARSERMARFLRFTVGKALDGKADELKEYLIGSEVFDRKASYDPRVDPIVRVEARRLRSKLRAYYEKEGRNDEVLIDYVTGSYVPRFAKRSPPRSDPPEPKDRERNVVVLPFTNLSSDAENEYFSDGLTEELIHRLTKVQDLRVVAWQSASQLKGKPFDLRQLGQDLHVGTALGGSVRRSGGRLRISVQLVRVLDGRYLWTETYERRLKDVFAIQDDISRAIAETLRIKLVSKAEPTAAGQVECDPVAYNLYLRGRYHWNRRSPDEIRKSIQFYNRAASIDPGLAVAYAGLADSYSLLAEYGLTRPSEAIPQARLAAEKAIELEPALAEAHTSLGLILSLYDWEWQSGEAHYRRAIELNPGYVTAHHWYGLDFLATVGRMREAERELRLAVRLDPLSSIINEGLGQMLMLDRRYEEAVEQYQKLLDLDPGFYKAHTAIGRVRSLMGNYEEAAVFLNKGRKIAGDIPNILGALGQTYALAGRKEEARRTLGELTALAERRYVPSPCFALIHAGLGEKSRALDWLELAFRQREMPLTSIRVHPAYDSLRSERRFTALLKRIWRDG